MADSTLPILDLAQFQRQTMGSESLQVEILSLFVSEVERLLRQVETAEDPQTRRDRIHAMVGLARNVGAVRLSRLAHRIHAQAEDGPAEIEPLREAVEETVGYIRVHAL